MSQEYFPTTGKGKGPAAVNDDEADAPIQDPTHHPTRPQYMTVGNGVTSEHAARLQHMIDVDSGYGGSIAGDEFHLMPAAANIDVPLKKNRRHSGALHQMWYNKQRAALGRSINAVLELLTDLQTINTVWPAHYPSVQRVEKTVAPRPPLPHSVSTESFALSPSIAENVPALRRALTVPPGKITGESRPVAEPRLVTPQIAREFSVLKLDLKLGSLHQAELVHSLEKGSVAALLDGKISSSIKHLLALRSRIEDTASKVLITGDLNAGKSTFCNALLRRKVLPEDQQPCTAIFCEVLDARENAGVEEVHAVHKEATYDRNNESTYDVFALSELENIVVDNDKYTQCKVYVKDERAIDESLLNNGVVDIALIDAPGLNSDTTKTTAIFARQEEIDVVVFVVSAANHFTQSAKEFIGAAAAEKAYIFMVVNGFDTIRDKQRCQKLVMDQVSHLSPRTAKESAELVHFVSSNAIPTSSPPGGPSGPSGSGSSSGGGGDDDPSGDDKGKGKDADKIRDFEALEQSLRRFVLEKRSRSKLAPARTYLLNILNDVGTLATVNQDVAKAELERVSRELREIEPQLESSKKARSEVDEEVVQKIEATCKDVYDDTRFKLNSAIMEAGSADYDVSYPGVFGAFSYADELKDAILSQISAAVSRCEQTARDKTLGGVNVIKQLGLLHVGDEFQNLQFRPDVMFKRKRDALARDVHVPTELWDFVDFSTLLHQQEKMAGTGMALTLATALVPRMVGMGNWMDRAMTATRVLTSENMRSLILPGIAVATIAAAAYIIQQIPNSLPPRLAAKISAQLADRDYVHANSTRISSSVRKILRFPADNLRVRLEESVKDLGKRRDETVKTMSESEQAIDFFGALADKSDAQRRVVDGVDLDAPPPGML